MVLTGYKIGYEISYDQGATPASFSASSDSLELDWEVFASRLNCLLLTSTKTHSGLVMFVSGVPAPRCVAKNVLVLRVPKVSWSLKFDWHETFELDRFFFLYVIHGIHF